MLKKYLSELFLTATLILANQAQALPIIQADAFEAGDNKAVLETNTGLLWMDFGITNYKSYQQVISELDSTYSGWRLPTETEITGLWTTLFGHHADWFSFDTFGMVKTPNEELGNQLQSIMNIWGFNSPSEAAVYENDELVLQYPIIGGFSTFQFDNGRYGQALMYRSLDGVNDHAAMFYDLYDQSLADGPGGPFANTLLVKSSSTNVPEPSTLMILALGLFGLYQQRRIV